MNTRSTVRCWIELAWLHKSQTPVSDGGAAVTSTSLSGNTEGITRYPRTELQTVAGLRLCNGAVQEEQGEFPPTVHCSPDGTELANFVTNRMGPARLAVQLAKLPRKLLCENVAMSLVWRKYLKYSSLKAQFNAR